MPTAGQRQYGERGGGPPAAVPGFTWQPVEGTLGSQWQLPQYELTPIPGYGTTPTPATAGTSPASTTPYTQFPQIPNFGLPDLQQLTAALNQTMQQGFQQAAQNRIPGQAGLEQESSSQIQQLLNPPAFYPEVDRRSAETAGLLGMPGEAPASDARNIRMTREEQLRDIGLGQQFLTAALGRNPIGPQYDPSGLANYLAQLPQRRAEMLTQQQQFAAQQQQARDLALAQMENSWRIAQLGALRGGSHLVGNPYGRGFPSTFGLTPSATSGGAVPTIPEPTPEGYGVASSYFPDVNAAFQLPAANQGYDLPVDIPIDFGAPELFDTESLYA